MKTDYKKLSEGYDLRYLQNTMPDTFKFLKKIIEQNKFGKILEVGCGTGYWLKLLNRRGLKLFGLDFSLPMLNKAKKDSLILINGNASRLPFQKKSFDFIFCINSFHHFPDKKKFLRDTFDLLRENGILSIVIADIFNPSYRWYVYDYFPGTFEIDAKRLPSPETIGNWLIEAGFESFSIKTVETIKDVRKGEAVLTDHFITRKGSSTLFALSDEAYFKGLERIKKDARKENSLFVTNVIFKAVIAKVY